MIKSMTGYGLSKLDDKQIGLSVEIKTLNSKFLDAIVKLPREFSDKELEVRNMLSDKLIRGKVSITVTYAKKEDASPKVAINENLFGVYYHQLEKLANESGANQNDIFKLALQMPDVVVNELSDEDLEEEWKLLSESINEALGKCDAFRISEGSVLKQKLVQYIQNIQSWLNKVNDQDPKRAESIKEKISQKMSDLIGLENVDQNRFEQELIYYIEKLDISEEKVRLKSHLDYFLQVIESDQSQGKKLGFISQEIGREINTIGSKANDAVIQRYVVSMKEELEKIKEQLLNIL
ncbi:YicC/YloC family endoribonuclease [Fulvivirgaceae bacterium BMA10]|uniref:YicC/YloC family endoribonuclease n=1 Tax=Splendidivirga corallicola TaxID=3051826 RepID=A0ABT8KLD7_9BACT|nr:YicC/YloC family endoribonuclease [Fulvivirgaceae bacterium BMA10]